MGLKLFDDGGSDSDGGAGDLSKIEINEEFARRYEHNKKREDLQRFEELKKKGVIESDAYGDEDDESSEDEEDLVNYSSKQDLEFFDALIKVKNQDPSLKSKDAKLFDLDNEDDDEDEEEDDDDAEDNNKEKKKKPMYLKDVTAKHLIEEGPEFEDEEDEKEDTNKKTSYFEEQELLRKEFLDAVGDEDVEGEFLKIKNDKRSEEDEDDDDREYEKKLNEYFKEDEKLDENEKFLKEYFRKKMWLDKDNAKGLGEDGLDVLEDEEELERQEDYEREFNFRFEENAGDRVMGFSRKVEGSVRKKENARKLQRKNKEERMAQVEFERKEELKHLKNLKKKEMNEKLRKIRETAGIGENEVCLLDEHDLEEEFDPEDYDRKMKKAFDDKFYDGDDVDPEFGSDEEDGELKKPNFDEEDELFGFPKGWDDQYGAGDGFLATRQRTMKCKVDNAGDEERPQDGEETVSEEGKRKQKRSQLEKEVINRELEEYYKLDYEDTIGDLKTRFKYRPVNKNTYGLKPKEILVVDDKELNQLVPLKKLATYREDEFIVPRHKIKEQKQRIKSLLKGETSNDPNNGRKRSKHDVEKSTQQVGDAETEKPRPGAQNEDQKVLSRKQRRKKRLNEFKLTPSRLLAYQKITGKTNNKRRRKT